MVEKAVESRARWEQIPVTGSCHSQPGGSSGPLGPGTRDMASLGWRDRGTAVPTPED